MWGVCRVVLGSIDTNTYRHFPVVFILMETFHSLHFCPAYNALTLELLLYIKVVEECQKERGSG